MTKCAVKNCKNHCSIHLEKDGVTYHRFPQNYDLRKNWRKLIAIDRNDVLYKPNNSSVICSCHFSESEMYLTKKGFRRLKKCAIPQIKIDHLTIPDVRQSETKRSYACMEAESFVPVEEHGQTSELSDGMNSTSNFQKPVKEHLGGELTCSSVTPGCSSDLNSQNIPHEPALSSILTGLSSVLNSPKTSHLRNQLKKYHRRIIMKDKQIKNLKKQNKRLVRSNLSLKELIKDLKKKRLIDESLCSKITDTDESIMKILLSRQKFTTYPPVIRKFALTIHFYSPAAYQYLRRIFKTRLPHPSSLFRWYQNVQVQPGFTAEALTRLDEKSKKSTTGPLLCSLLADEMAIRQQKIWTGSKYEGLVDMGIGTDDTEHKASQAFVFFIVSLQEGWTLPIAYFFIQSLSGEMKANLINIALQKCYDVGVKIVSVTFDGCKSNLNCMKALGCDLDNHDDMKSVFKHPCGDYDVAVLLDARHMVKLIRNHLEAKKEFGIVDGTIKWKYIEALHNLQDENKLNLANKLTQTQTRHIHFRNEIMKVKLATQLLSKSVANAIELCDKELKIQNFAESASTVKFLSLINDLFDILNSRNFNDYGIKKPLNAQNASCVMKLCDQAKFVLLSLSTKLSYKKTITVDGQKRTVFYFKEVPLHKCKANTGVLGLITCINSVKNLYTTLVETGNLSYLTMCKFSQDHLELFFAKMRSLGGHNNNPNTRQFKSAYMKLLSDLELSSKFSGNCVPHENFPVLSGSQVISSTSRAVRHDDVDEDIVSKMFIEKQKTQKDSENKYSNNCDHLSLTLRDTPNHEVTKQIVGYISGFVVYHLLKSLDCDDCRNNLLATDKQWFHKLVDLKDMGGLCYASKDVYTICCQVESSIRHHINLSGGNMLRKKYDKAFMTVKVVQKISDIQLFNQIDAHTKDQFDHVYHLTKAIIEKYIDIRMHYISRQENMEKKCKCKRQVWNKINLFQGT